MFEMKKYIPIFFHAMKRGHRRFFLPVTTYFFFPMSNCLLLLLLFPSNVENGNGISREEAASFEFSSSDDFAPEFQLVLEVSISRGKGLFAFSHYLPSLHVKGRRRRLCML